MKRCNLTTSIIAVLSLVFVIGCTGSDLPGKCDAFCNKSDECNEDIETTYSRTSCELNCTIAHESADYMGCKDEYEDYEDCVIDLKCKDWDEKTKECDDEWEDYQDCEQDFLD